MEAYAALVLEAEQADNASAPRPHAAMVVVMLSMVMSLSS